MKKKSTNTIKLNAFVILGTILFFIVIIARISYLSLSKNIDGINLQEFAKKRTTKTDVLYAKRGSIYDVNENVLAQNVSSYTVIAYLDPSRTTNPENPKHVVDKEYTAKKLSEILDMDYDKTLAYLSKENIYQTELGNKAKGISELTKEKIEELKLPGIDFIETQKRNYPYGRFLSYTLGYAKLRTEENENGKPEEKIVGELGIEAKFDKELSGTDGYNYYQKDRNGYKIAGTKELTEPAKDGNNIYLTIDASIQLFVEQAISKALDKYDADWMTIMVANAKTGAILASSTYPTFDPNLRDMTNYLDYNISYAYEPGSTMKIFSYMATMENGEYNGSEKYTSGIYKTKDGTEIGDWLRSGWGKITYDQGFALSSNVGVINLINKHLNGNLLMDYYKKLGFGSKTNIELANEVSGKLAFKYETEVFNAGFGQGITTTPIQNIKALTSISNNGTLLQPYIIDKIVDQNTGKVIYKGKKKELEKVASTETVSKIKDLMESVINGNSRTSTGYYYYMDGYDIIAKTGTAQIARESGKGYYNNQVIRGFAGMFPKDNPEVIMYVAAKNPSSIKLMSEVVKEIVKNTSNYLGIYNGKKEENKNLTKYTLDSYINNNVDTVKDTLTKNKINVVVIGNGNRITIQYPKAGATVSEIDKVFLVTNSNTDIMPDITGYSKSEVIVLQKLLNIKVEFSGTGYVYEQSIKAGDKFKPGETIKVRLKEKK